MYIPPRFPCAPGPLNNASKPCTDDEAGEPVYRVVLGAVVRLTMAVSFPLALAI